MRTEEERWREYYEARKGNPPRPTLTFALERFDAENPRAAQRLAVDMGCGDGPDTAELLRRGWRVFAFDGQEEAIGRLRERADLPPDAALETRIQRFEAAIWPDAPLLINASFSLPFCPLYAFPALWDKMVASLPAGGRFSGQLFGDRDEWANGGRTVHHTEAQAIRLLAPFDLERFIEEERDAPLADGSPKHWHCFHIVGKKR